MPIALSLFLLLISVTTKASPLVVAANERLEHFVVYDGSYQSIPYPMGDVDANKGVCTDVIIRSYRTLGIDLQQLVHEDMQKHFAQYPTAWGLSKPDSNIDHRRVPNLETFFRRHGESLPVSRNSNDYKPGEIVTWRLSNSNLPHIGIVSDQRAVSGNFMIIHNIGLGPQINDMIFDHPISGHYQFSVDQK
jgi:uncharacterized protein YijF (DUF1287 family)